MRNLKFSVIAAAVLSFLMFTTAAGAAEVYSRYDRIGMLNARAVALNTQSGVVTREMLVRDMNGREKYIFVIERRGVSRLVSVDAVSGRVIGNVRESGPPVYRSKHRSSNFWDRLFAPTHVGP